MFWGLRYIAGSGERDLLQLVGLRPEDRGCISISLRQLRSLGARLEAFAEFRLGIDSRVRTIWFVSPVLVIDTDTLLFTYADKRDSCGL